MQQRKKNRGKAKEKEERKFLKGVQLCRVVELRIILTVIAPGTLRNCRELQ